MLNNRLRAAQTVADRLLAAEAALDEALSLTADLLAEMPRQRLAAGLSATFGQDAINGAVNAQVALVEARRQLSETHQRLEETRIQIGLRTVALGGGMIKPAVGSGAGAFAGEVSQREVA